MIARTALVAVLLLASSTGAASQSRCADCRFANPAAPARTHLDEWQHSAHGRQAVGCEKCHGEGRPLLQERLGVARQRAEQLLDELANPPGR